MKRRNKLLINASIVTPEKFSDFLNEILKIADFDETTSEITYDDDEETGKKIAEILDKYFL